MSRVLRPLVATIGLILGLLVAPAALASAEPGDPVAECVAGEGIYLYVFEQQSPVVEGCTHAETAMGRLLELTEVNTIGQGFICQIDSRPERCVNTSGGDDPYWNFWWWRDGAWVYATIGGSYPGTPGSVEAWHYSSGVEPPVTPPVGSAPGASASPAASASPNAESSAAGNDPEPAADPMPGWLPTAITVGVLGLLAGGYLAWRRNKA